MMTEREQREACVFADLTVLIVPKESRLEHIRLNTDLRSFDENVKVASFAAPTDSHDSDGHVPTAEIMSSIGRPVVVSVSSLPAAESVDHFWQVDRNQQANKRGHESALKSMTMKGLE
jgi:hypothetical protein